MEGREDLAQIVSRSANNALALGTLRAYAAMRKRFAEFASSFANVNPNLGKYRNLFIAQLVHTGQLKSINLATAALNFYYGHLKDGDLELQKLLIDSAKREVSPVVHRRKATEEDMSAVVDWALKEETQIAVTDSCIALLSFLAFLRISEAAGVKKSHIENKGNDTWWLRIPKSKTDQCGTGSTVAFQVQGRFRTLWEKFIHILSSKSMDQFVFATAAGTKPTTDALRKRLNAVLISSGLGQKCLTSHSFRGGAATVALRKGVRQEDIKRVGRWKSTSAMLHYIEPTPI